MCLHCFLTKKEIDIVHEIQELMLNTGTIQNQDDDD